MLSKDICKKCFKANGHQWRHADTNWFKNYSIVCCCAVYSRDHIVSVNINTIPEKCFFKFEQAVAMGKNLKAVEDVES